ncbi:MAG: hypothetical protein HY674_14270 [Chloroflexi bacterium]|nr:hypothetical protein [Chloroflexota bacterium]
MTVVAQDARPIVFNTSFEGGSLGKIESLGEGAFRCFVEGQHDERGRNRQANWYFFRMDNVKGRDIALTLTDFIGEYNDKPGACPMSPDIVPVFSNDGEEWQHFAGMRWDNERKEATLNFRPTGEPIWIAHIPPYTPRRLQHLLGQVDQTPHARIEVIGKTVQGRELQLVTVTDFERPDAAKKTVWLQARQHAWEAGTSYVMEGALLFITSDDLLARRLRGKVVFLFLPMMDPDGCANGKVRFNAHGYDVNRHWNEVDLRRKEFLQRMPEIWYVKKALLGCVDSGRKIDLMLNLHNTESAEFMDTQADDEPVLALFRRFEAILMEKTSFDPTQRLAVRNAPGNTTNSLYEERRIPVLLMEQRIGFSQKLGRRPTVGDRLNFGRQLIAAMAEAVLAKE